MERRNDGIEYDDILQNQFTAYLQKSMRNRRIRYIDSNRKYLSATTFQPEDLLTQVDDCLTVDKSVVLLSALRKMQERERKIVCMRAVQEYSFGEIAAALGMKYSSVTMIYYRALEKLRLLLREDTDRVY